MRDKNDWCIYSKPTDPDAPSNQVGVSEVCDEDMELLSKDYDNLEVEFEMINGKAKLNLFAPK